MSHLPDRLPGRVDEPRANHLLRPHGSSNKGADSHALDHPRSTGMTRVGRAAAERMASLLSERELAILRSVRDYRYLSASQIQALHFHDHASPASATRTCRRVLERLTRAQLLLRTERRIGGVRAGSASYVYGTSELGYRLLHSGEGRKRWKEPSPAFLDHTLAVADAAIAVIDASRRNMFDLLDIQTEPATWCSFQKGLSGTEILKPDLFVALGVGDYEDRWFIEIDRATESSVAVLRKCRTYLDYRATGVEEREHDVFPRVLWAVPHERRAEQLRRAFRNATLPMELFTVTTNETMVATLLAGSDA